LRGSGRGSSTSTSRWPQTAAECLNGGRLHPSLSANLDGETFVTDPAAVVRRGQSLLILSADAGG
jgi:hypothetical protein